MDLRKHHSIRIDEVDGNVLLKIPLELYSVSESTYGIQSCSVESVKYRSRFFLNWKCIHSTTPQATNYNKELKTVSDDWSEFKINNETQSQQCAVVVTLGNISIGKLSNKHIKVDISFHLSENRSLRRVLKIKTERVSNNCTCLEGYIKKIKGSPYGGRVFLNSICFLSFFSLYASWSVDSDKVPYDLVFASSAFALFLGAIGSFLGLPSVSYVKGFLTNYDSMVKFIKSPELFLNPAALSYFTSFFAIISSIVFLASSSAIVTAAKVVELPIEPINRFYYYDNVRLRETPIAQTNADTIYVYAYMAPNIQLCDEGKRFDSQEEIAPQKLSCNAIEVIDTKKLIYTPKLPFSDSQSISLSNGQALTSWSFKH